MVCWIQLGSYLGEVLICLGPEECISVFIYRCFHLFCDLFILTVNFFFLDETFNCEIKATAFHHWKLSISFFYGKSHNVTRWIPLMGIFIAQNKIKTLCIEWTEIYILKIVFDERWTWMNCIKKICITKLFRGPSIKMKINQSVVSHDGYRESINLISKSNKMISFFIGFFLD